MTDMTDASSERMMTPELMITGEAVALEVTPASVGLRLLSGLIDYGLYAAGAVLTGWPARRRASLASATVRVP